jgi:hypothetical protein
VLLLFNRLIFFLRVLHPQNQRLGMDLPKHSLLDVSHEKFNRMTCHLIEFYLAFHAPCKGVRSAVVTKGSNIDFLTRHVSAYGARLRGLRELVASPTITSYYLEDLAGCAEKPINMRNENRGTAHHLLIAI